STDASAPVDPADVSGAGGSRVVGSEIFFRDLFGVAVDGRKVCCLGLSYKADIDDLRESASIEVALQLADAGFEVSVVEPHVKALPRALAGRANVRLVDLDQGLAANDVVVLLTDHREFRELDRSRLAGKAAIDTRGAWRVRPPEA
ncbi:MAG: UDP binding domain-containing protein, partial [Rhodospirillaceae bacterium]